MRTFRDLPLKRKLTIISMVTSGVALLLACAVIAMSELRKARAAMLTETLTLARIIGDNSAAALTFGDPDSARQTLQSLVADPHITGAIIYDLEGRPFAQYQPPGSVPLTPPPVQRNFHRYTDDSLVIFQERFADDYIEVFRDISAGGEPVGTVYLRHNMIELRDSLVQSGYLMLGVIAMASLVAWGLTRQFVRLVAGPIMDLGDVVRGVATDKVQRFGHEQLSTWGIGADLDVRQWSGVFRQLVAAGLLEADVDRHNALRLTALATPVLRGERTLRFRKDAPRSTRRRERAGAAPMIELAPEAALRFDALREWRATTAREQNVPAYVIFHDATLRAIAEADPGDLDDLAGIAGIGGTKLERYGEAVLQQLFDVA